MGNALEFSSVVLSIIRRVREMLLPQYGKVEFQAKKSDRAHDTVTQADISVEEYYKKELAACYPDIAFVGEETGGNRAAKRFWLVDPIDGTSHFIRGMPFCTSQLACIENGRVVFAAIYDFVNDIMYHAERRRGAFANGEPIRVSARSFQGSYLAWETHLDKQENMSRFLRLREHCLLFKAGCSGFEFAMVASGKLDGRLCFDPHGKDYDFAPGSLLVAEAGGIVANIGLPAHVLPRKNSSGLRDYDYRNLNFIAANPLVFKELTEGPDAVFPTK
ncbi:MAG: hypothetical protein A2W52_04040 [Candidatus Taylorbacteria bacterium RIFCSPHIGHO2_02_49_25]|uniref:Inositol monophosphatase n=1 Tax=Candidatus Taylorbacteria bacterium RIFCSPHIGHO2_02_49_25 TaxID=1802305 RepID=A0A1G2MHM5_9BACT|nr:MAG: Inositol-1(Or 4)-monophosphatase [Parcubacteria group bacterium GW2011_GWF2_50_9]OHA20539.1 MAG: hypothetical protein A2759_01505 [Candidatus Taylorbacteria bacterium RIFCSPHIGHO2_01_FULL_49_60]OHA23343.1 MAG: hypothetical protein A2W52_04040 [Candidatus Taylorbacteria bacterium RIFCSPHIGHO2_02_49_25]OHA35346.1 MAG: hypothetical protein A3B27_02725 [Candidatus Taylorbacteria bacterium RIFCSPLOWO2_01_FULL_50_130]OHA36771.1 MAG: hypothetical protein A2W65_04380 [Candidatus Taylorbacteria 